MTIKQREQYEIRYNLDSYICQKCGKPANQIAHRLSKSKVNYKKYGKDIIDHNINLVSVCCLECNDSYNIGCSPVREKKLVELIKSRKSLTNEEINDIID